MVKITFASPTKAAPHALVMHLTHRAAAKLAAILANKPDQFLRVRVHGGGCNGYTYHLALASTPEADDYPLKHPATGATLARVDAASLALLHDSTLDFEETLEISRFIINNPNATSGCGCGNSFGL